MLQSFHIQTCFSCFRFSAFTQTCRQWSFAFRSFQYGQHDMIHIHSRQSSCHRRGSWSIYCPNKCLGCLSTVRSCILSLSLHHIPFYIGMTSVTVFAREQSRIRKFQQLWTKNCQLLNQLFIGGKLQTRFGILLLFRSCFQQVINN